MSPRLLLVLLIFLLAVMLRAQQAQPMTQPNPSPNSLDELVSYEASNAPITAVLQEYEKLTGKTLIEDSNLMANAVPLTISLPHPVKKGQLIRLIEAALLLNNYALIPGPGENTMKVINLSTGKNARSEGVRLYTSPEDMPTGEEIISYYMPLNHISANEALTVFNTHILPRAYTSFVPVSSAQAVVITETTNVIRGLIALKDLIDVPPAATSTEFVQLIRADAERVADTLSKLLDGGGGQPRTPGAPQPQNVVVGNAPSGTVIAGLQAQLIPDTRTNRILIVTRPQNMETLRGLVLAFDQAAVAAQPLEYKLRYIPAGEALPVLSDLLREEQQPGAGGTPLPQGQQQQVGQTRTVNLGGGRGMSTGATQTGGGYSPVSGTAGSVGAGQDLLQEPNEQLGPQSVIVGKTRIISDAKDNKIIVIGPPESIQKVRILLDRLDRRPQQVYLSTVIGQLQLSNETDFGVDFTQTYKKISQNAGVASSNLSSTGTQAGIFNSSGQIVIDPRQILTSGVFPGTQGLAIYGSITDAIRVFIRAVDQRDKFTILARPAVYTANNKRAVISSGQRVPIPGTTLSNVATNAIGVSNTAAVQATIEYEDVELRLEVIPLINSNREVTLKIAQINDTLGNNVTIAGNTVPIVNSQRLTTTVTVPSGATVVLGGLINDQIKKSESGIPVVDQLPYLGNFFKFQTHTRSRSELLVFIQPTVVENNIETLRASLKEEKRTKVGSEINSLANPEDYASPAPDENIHRRKPDK
jgi:general secretion pathway protein D